MGKGTRVVLALGLVCFGALALVPNTHLHAVYAVLLTPVAAALATAGELAIKRYRFEALSLFAAVALVSFAVWWSTR